MNDIITVIYEFFGLVPMETIGDVFNNMLRGAVGIGLIVMLYNIFYSIAGGGKHIL